MLKCCCFVSMYSLSMLNAGNNYTVKFVYEILISETVIVAV